ncbi:MAG TPA: glycosyltransferase family 9 protein [Vicinamibacterales bacterium]|nr:glycosyltransferase family 9 protein [Vicinamibacterales bacterium]
MARLTITDRRERALVAVADAAMRPAVVTRRFRRAPAAPARILCLRLERIGDLLLTAPALAALHAALPDATIDLVVGSWNRDLAGAMPGVTAVETVDAAWLSRGGNGLGPLGLAMHATRWRRRKYDLAINFEPDIRSNLAMAMAGVRWTAGFASGGGGPLLDLALDYDVGAHVADNAIALVEAATSHWGPHAPATPALSIPAANRAEAERLLSRFAGMTTIGLQVSAGRAIKQWPEERFRTIAERLVRDRGAAIVLAGSPADRAQVDAVLSALPPERAMDLSGGTPLLTVAAVLERLDLFVTGDTGPMHLAHLVGTPVVAIFGPSEPRRYAPRGSRDHLVRIDLPCSPCNRIRRPPGRCTGHTPDCLAGIDTARVLAAIDEALRGGAR